ncbi:alpha/beta hydrolase [Amycolatopsis sulphurea]|uniref:alpha/beta hydrolase n=1 Tax=Amycolatopsis sulphurea TaxID=76022 RepID=UPI0014738E42|nr:alpha/beta hydrolase [Amycolatopsis sulphurea]
MQHDTPVNDAVVFGSPGLGANSRADLKVPEGHMFSAWSDQDPVPSLDVANHFGASPYDDAQGRIASDSLDGIHRLSTENAVGVDGQPLHVTHEHGQYLEGKSTSQYNMASVVAGRPDLKVSYIPPDSLPSPPPTPGQPIPAPPGRVPQPPPR